MRATHSGNLKIGEIVIRCHVLEDGRRLLSGRAVTRAMGLTGRGQGMARFLTSKSLKSFVNKDLVLAIEWLGLVFWLFLGHALLLECIQQGQYWDSVISVPWQQCSPVRQV